MSDDDGFFDIENWVPRLERSQRRGQKAILPRRCGRLYCCGFDPSTTDADKGQEASDPRMRVTFGKKRENGGRTCTHDACKRHPLTGLTEEEQMTSIVVEEDVTEMLDAIRLIRDYPYSFVRGAAPRAVFGSKPI